MMIPGADIASHVATTREGYDSESSSSSSPMMGQMVRLKGQPVVSQRATGALHALRSSADQH